LYTNNVAEVYITKKKKKNHERILTNEQKKTIKKAEGDRLQPATKAAPPRDKSARTKQGNKKEDRKKKQKKYNKFTSQS